MKNPSDFNEEQQQRLTNFLRQHRPTPPPAAFNLEDRILNQISSQPAPTHKTWSFLKAAWVIPATVTVAAVLSWQLGKQMHQPVISEAESTIIEASLIGAWSGSIEEGEDLANSSESLYADANFGAQ